MVFCYSCRSDSAVAEDDLLLPRLQQEIKPEKCSSFEPFKVVNVVYCLHLRKEALLADLGVVAGVDAVADGEPGVTGDHTVVRACDCGLAEEADWQRPEELGGAGGRLEAGKKRRRPEMARPEEWLKLGRGSLRWAGAGGWRKRGIQNRE
ncbi:hypothetical protein Cni_G07334 [Canna indica]|uniref:Uncharacterized protein n=1 Tax=Canna indica TaxID=4628 RepID=A0AAQ3JYS3_9LILI|nr:hypothetical protein Cni_G07334 [Canna indica]